MLDLYHQYHQYRHFEYDVSNDKPAKSSGPYWLIVIVSSGTPLYLHRLRSASFSNQNQQ